MAEQSEQKYSYDDMDPKTLEKVKKELNENPQQVHAHIESFRRWVKSMPHIVECPTDDAFLLRFLRVAKFDHSKAQKRLDNFCTVRGSETRGFPDWFKPVDVNDPLFIEVLSLNRQINLGHTDDNPVLFLEKPSAKWDPEKRPIEKVIPLMFAAYDVMICNDRFQTHGMANLVDLEGIGMQQLAAMGNKALFKKMITIWQDAYPIRIKGNFYYKEPVLFDAIMKMVEFFIDEKHKSRMYRIQSDLNKFYEKYPNAQEILPTEYGGKAGSMSECGYKWQQQVIDFHSKGSPFLNIRVDESKRPASTLNYLREYSEYEDQTLETQETSTKLHN